MVGSYCRTILNKGREMNIFKIVLLSFIFFANSVMADDGDPDFSAFSKYTLSAKEVAALKKIVGRQMKDPKSVVFLDDTIRVMIHKKDNVIGGCIQFNAKNSYGGYDNPSVAAFFTPKNRVDLAMVLVLENKDAAELESCVKQYALWSK
jgi:hypothetical protein